MNIGFAIKEVRKCLNLTQIELAKKAGITQSALSQIEAGTRPGEKTLIKLSKALGTPVPIFFLLSLEKTDFPKQKQPIYELLEQPLKDIIMRLCN